MDGLKSAPHRHPPITMRRIALFSVLLFGADLSLAVGYRIQ
jgi:hypothetical protein